MEEPWERDRMEEPSEAAPRASGLREREEPLEQELQAVVAEQQA